VRLPTRRPLLHAFRPALLAVLLGALLSPLMAVAHADGRREEALSSAQARELLDVANQRAADAETRLREVEAERQVIDSERSTMTIRQQELAQELELAKRNLRQLAVTSYVSGGPAGGAERILDAEGFNESIWRAALIEEQTDRTVESAKRYDELLVQADAAVRALVDRVDQNQAKLEVANLDFFYASIEAKAAEEEYQAARIRERIASARAAAPSWSDGGGEDAWARLRNCESGGNYQSVSSSGKYRGAYQFDQRTWESVGGEGDPAAAPPEEQDLRARILYSRSGNRPWPHCGRFLP